MKKKILSIIFLVETVISYSQNYPPFLQNIGWCVEEYIGTGSIMSSYTNSGDTTIGNLSYSKLNKDNKLFLIREDHVLRKVWVILPNGSSEILLYDFAISPGTQISLNYFGNIAVLYHADSFDSINTTSGVRKRIKLSTNDTVFSSTIYWIEGIGSNFGPVYLYDPTYAPGLMNEGHCLICSYSGPGVQSYSGSCGIPCVPYAGSPCYPFIVGISEITNENTRIMVENVNDNLIRIQLNRGKIKDLEVFSIEGSLLKIIHDVDKNEFYIFTNDWTKGLYIIQAIIDNGIQIKGKIFIKP